MAIQRPQLAPRTTAKKRIDDDLDELVDIRAPAAKPAKSETNVGLGRTVADAARANPAPAKKPAPTGGRVNAVKAGEDDLDELVDARDAAEGEIDAANAQATQEQRARSGLMGGGLSGASSAAEGDLARQQGRSKALAMQEFDRQAEDADFTDIQRRAAIMDLEDAYDTDIDGDGKVNGRAIDGAIGDGNIENDPAEAPRGTDAERVALSEWTAVLDVNDYNQSPFGDADTQPGSFEEPYDYAGTKTGLEAAISEYAPGALPLKKLQGKDGTGGNVTIYVDQYGNHYTISEDTGAPSRREAEVRR